MVNTITEMSGKDDAIEKAVSLAREEVRLMFRKSLAASFGADDPRTESGSWILLNLFLGLRVLARSGPTREQVEPIIDAAFHGIR